VHPASPPSPQAGFVRPARAADADDLTRVQVASWGCDLAAVVPAQLLAELTGAEAAAVWRERWREAITSPPTSRHRVLVAVADTAGAAGTDGGPSSAASGAGLPRPVREVVGLVSAGPATDADRWPATDAEIYEFRVRPDRTRQGHGSRLLQAAADTLAADGFHTASTWILESDTEVRGFLESSGWAADGARGELEVGVRVPVVRLHTRLSE
jgi:ribosomal protein S18 acetylase RimI-like enzyme